MPGQQFAQGAGPKSKRGFGPGNTNPNIISTPLFSRGALPSQGVADGSMPDPAAAAAEPAGAASASTSGNLTDEERRRRRAEGRNAVSSTQSTTGGFSAAKTLLGQ